MMWLGIGLIVFIALYFAIFLPMMGDPRIHD